MKICIQLLMLSLLVSCSTTLSELNPRVTEGLLTNQEIDISGITREYHIYVPDQSKNAPVLMILHGHGGSFNQLLGLNGVKSPHKLWLDIAKDENMILVVPNGKAGSDKKLGWNDKYQADADRVYVQGISNGGLMSQRLAEEFPEKLAAVGVVVASRPMNSICKTSSHPLSILYMSGTDDPILPYEQGSIITNRGEMMATEDAVQHWVARNGTNKTPSKVDFPNINGRDKSVVEKYTYTGGVNDTEVVLYKMIGAGHAEPSKVEKFGRIYLALVGAQNCDIEMAHEIWEFFKDKRRRQ